jgi:hypothetical protein
MNHLCYEIGKQQIPIEQANFSDFKKEEAMLLLNKGWQILILFNIF